MNREKISVCIATYNGEEYIEKQIKSILNQSKQVDEIIISDDGSTDLTLEIIKKINNSKIKIINNKKKGVINNFENSLKNSTGDYIFLCDQDDIWKSNKVEKISELLKENDLVIHNAKIIGKDDEITNDKDFFEIRNSKKGIIKNLYKNSYIGCCMAFNKKILNKSLPFPSNIPMHDSWIGLIAEMYGKVYFTEDILFYYRRHENNVTQLNNTKNNKYKQIQLRWQLIKNLILRRVGI